MRVCVLSQVVCLPVLMSFCGPFNLASGSFLASPSLISNSLNLPFGIQSRSWRLKSCLWKAGTGGTKSLSYPGTPQGPSWFHTKERQVKERSLHKDVLSLTVPDSLTVRGCSISFLCPNFNIFIGNAQTDQLFRCICKIWNKTQSGLFLFFWPNVRV